MRTDKSAVNAGAPARPHEGSGGGGARRHAKEPVSYVPSLTHSHTEAAAEPDSHHSNTYTPSPPPHREVIVLKAAADRLTERNI